MYSIMIHATDLRENHFDLCKKAVELAARFDARLHLLHVISPPTSLQLAQGLGFAELAAPVKDDAITVLSVIGETLNIPKEQQHVEVGSLKKILLEKVDELGCSLIILGAHQPQALPRFLGSTTSATLLHAPCDVLIVHL
ncbi:MAG: universal stress protein [Legionella sp.]|nr:universal stress protein [Legionella sp.]